MKRDEFEKIYAAVFDDSPRWRRWFFDEVVGPDADSDIFIETDSGGRPAAAALLKPFDFQYAGTVVPSGYISCVGTRPDVRTRGLASAAVAAALDEARRRGYAFCELIPANRSLYSFYSRFGFAGVFYADEERYTSLHAFAGAEVVPEEPSFALFHSVESSVGCGVLHSEADFRHIMDDLAFESGRSAVFARAADGAAACLFASWDARRPGSTVTVRSLIAGSEAAATGALAVLRAETPGRPFTVWRPPLSGSKAHLRVRGMARIVSAQAVLGALAAAHPALSTTISLADTGESYCLAAGECRLSPVVPRPSLDVTTPVLTSILFSSPATGNIFGLPARRPYMSLMLDK